MPYVLLDAFGKTISAFKTKAQAQSLKRQLAAQGKSTGTGKGLKIVKTNPPRRKKATRRSNAPKSRTISLKGFTGKIRQLANGALIVKGKGRKK
jgi:hypothetical protein